MEYPTTIMWGITFVFVFMWCCLCVCVFFGGCVGGWCVSAVPSDFIQRVPSSYRDSDSFVIPSFFSKLAKYENGKDFCFAKMFVEMAAVM